MISTNEFKAIAELDLDPIKVKLMHKESGEGWTLEYANLMEFEYRRFLYLTKMFADETIAPLLFGYFLHHYPYLGLRGDDDQGEHQRVGSRMLELYEQAFGEPCVREEPTAEMGALARGHATTSRTAWCFEGGNNASAGKTAWCFEGGNSAKAVRTAWCFEGGNSAKAARTAWCFEGGNNAKAINTAWCFEGGNSAKAARTAWCFEGGNSAKATRTAWCFDGRAPVKPSTLDRLLTKPTTLAAA
jgi:hypothetical protein